MRQPFTAWALVVSVGVTSACANIGQDQNSNVTASTAAPSACADATPLIPTMPALAQRPPSTGDTSTNCRPSDAPQGYYSITIPPGQRAIVTATPDASTAWRIVARAYAFCGAATCIGDQASPSAGAPVVIRLANEQPFEVTRIVSFSAWSAAETGVFDATVHFEPIPPPPAACLAPTSLDPGTTLHDQTTPDDGVPSEACRPSDAPQRFYLARVPPWHRAIITASPTGAPWSPVVRVLWNCTADHCQTDETAPAPGHSAEVSIDNRVTSSEPFYYVVSVSAESAAVHGTYDLAMRLEPIADPCTLAANGDLDAGRGSLSIHGFAPPSTQATYRLHVPRRMRVALAVRSNAFDPTVSVSRACRGFRDGSDNRTRTSLDAASSTVLDPGEYAVQVGMSLWDNGSGFSFTGGAFDLTMVTSDAPANSTCLHAALLSPAAPALDASMADGDDLGVGCGFSYATPQLFYRLEVPAHTRATITAAQRGDTTGTGEPSVRLMAACTYEQSRVCEASQAGRPAIAQSINDTDTPRSVVVAVSQGSRMYVRSSPTPSHFDLRVAFDALPVAAPPANATCAGARSVDSPIDMPDEHMAVRGSQAQPSLFYRTMVPPGAKLIATLEPHETSWRAAVTIETMCNEAPSFGGGFFASYRNTGTTPQIAFVRVSGDNPAVDASFALSLAIVGTTTPDSRASCSTAAAIDASTVFHAQDLSGGEPFGFDDSRLFYPVTIPAGRVMTARVTQPPSNAVRLELDDACGGAQLASAFSGELSHRNDTGHDEHIVLVAYGATPFQAGSVLFDLAVQIEDDASDSACASPTPVADGTVLHDQSLRAGGLATNACGAGRMRFYRAELPAGAVFTADAGPYDVLVLDSCEATHCITGSPHRHGLTTFTNPRSEARTIVFAVRGFDNDGLGFYDLTVSIRPPAFVERAIATNCDDMHAQREVPEVRLQGFAPVEPMPFPFGYFGQTIAYQSIDAGGFMRLLPASTPTDTQAFREARTNYVAPFRERWVYNPDGPSLVRVGTFGSAPSRHFTVEWDAWRMSYAGIDATFQAKLFEGTNAIEFHYCAISRLGETRRAGGEVATIGAVGPVAAWQHIHHYYDDGPITPNAAIRLEPAP